ncbi:MAG: ABC transporter ATP-binding protein [Deltaproteobacteria bacterium]|nr:ABC transporter ATP-binding protein [Deltaproteobacteria bacterium]
MALLEIINLAVSYGKAAILHGISLSLEEEEPVSIIGPNGAGKTTIMRTVLGFTSPQGTIMYQGRPIENLPSHEIVKMRIALCPERRRLFPEMTVLRNLEMGAYLRKDKKEVRQDLEKIFALFPALRERKTKAASTLSGGEQQMLAVARALMSNPRLLMLDEPSFGLAPLVKKLLIDIFHEIRKKGITILLAEQDALLALEIADRSYVLENGRIAIEGNKEDLIADPHVKEAYLGLA